ncbi:uncharacterized protein LOC130902128 [Diorhabda carinulata]|uniref:uncharacterized protein LOC130902128 n=1 Tax=Diorhabda carinulata TaxID=1163345 RepID=UPI0025A2448E|nr:uncharacterized protein LOC130902128 [Diorhabda carinulata]
MIIIIWCLIFIEFTFGASVLNCPPSELKFEKVLGLRPSNSTISRLLHQSNPSIISRPVTSECIAKCLTRDDCSSFVLFYSVSKCYYYSSNFSVVDDKDQVIDENVAWFIKKCLVTGSSCNKLWVFDRIPGATLIGNDTKTLQRPISRTDCEQYCLNETQFPCRSTKFTIIQIGPDSSTGIDGYPYGPNNYNAGVDGICILSNTDRHQLPSSFRVSDYEDEYLENQCSPNIENRNEFCAYEEYENMTLSNKDMLFERKTKEECQKMCDIFEPFNCRSFTIINGNLCYLHSEDTKIYGPNSLQDLAGAIYYEKANCLNISVTCSETYMTINYKPEINFKGKMYMEGFSDNPVCSANGQGGYNAISLQIPLLTGQCGIIKADGPVNRTLLSGNLLLQYNSYIQTQNDRLIRVGCIFGNETKVVIGTGVHVSPMLPNRGSVIIIPGNNATVPNVIMKVVDAHTGDEISDSQIGQDLQLQIILNKPDNLDIWASHLIAMTEKNDESIFLLDDRGCPTDPNIFPSLRKIRTDDYVELVANFKAFKFTNSPIIRFSVIIQFCVGICAPINCGGNILSHGRRKRQITKIETINGTTAVKINPTNNKQKSSQMFEMPLEYIMVVRDTNKYISDRLVIGDNKILVAGYDFATNEVCLDYSLVIALIILWILVQLFFIIGCIVLVRRYKRYYQHECTRQSLEELHKNFGLGTSNLDNRRVHWADNENIL